MQDLLKVVEKMYNQRKLLEERDAKLRQEVREREERTRKEDVEMAEEKAGGKGISG